MIINYQVTVADIATSWRLNNQLHRLDGPAIEWADGDKTWYVNGQLHREDGPAVEHTTGYKAWYTNDKRHRIDGHAVEFRDGYKEWWIDGAELTEQQFIDATTPVVEMTIAEIEKLLGKRIKVVK